jgi:peptide/nickel transport system permease protein
MTGFVLKRVGRGVLTVFGVLTVAFVILRLNGGSPAVAMLPEGRPEDIQALNRALGYDGPLQDQYAHFMLGAIRGDLGTSFQQAGVPALEVVLARLPATFELAITAFVLGAILGVVIAVGVQLFANERLRASMIWLGVVRQAIPTFVVGVLFVLFFSVKLGWLPSIGRGGLEHLVLPAVTLASFEVTLYMRLIGASLGEQEELDYVRTAYSKGLDRLVVLVRHMLPNALLPALTVAGLNFGAMLGGVVIVENVFAWPGIGQLMITSVNLRDYPVVQATLCVVAVVFITVNIVVDLLYAVLDPRVRVT